MKIYCSRQEKDLFYYLDYINGKELWLKVIIGVNAGCFVKVISKHGDTYSIVRINERRLDELSQYHCTADAMQRIINNTFDLTESQLQASVRLSDPLIIVNTDEILLGDR